MEKIKLGIKGVALVFAIIVFAWYVKITRYEYILNGNSSSITRVDKWNETATIVKRDYNGKYDFNKK